jgi:microcystin-dependent protein
MTALTPTAKMQFFKANGEPLVGGKLYTYTAGTTTPQPTYTDSAGGTANTNPVILDSRGEADIWLGGATYKFKLADANDVEIWTVDNISAPTSGVSPALSGNVTIDTNSSSPALKITQTGTGYALRVQDSVDPDLTPLVIDSTGLLGLGTTSPAEALDIDNNGKIQFSASGLARTVISADANDSIIDVKDDRNFVVKTNATTILTVNDGAATTTVPVVLPGNPSTSLQAAPKQYVDTAQTTAAPPGAITAFGASSAPTGWLTCDGSAVSRTTYATLFAVVGTTWGVGDGSTTFNVPDLRGQFLRGYDSRATSTSQDTTSISGVTTSGSATVSAINSTTYLYAGMPISGTGIPVGATISTISTNSITLSANATASSPTVGTGATTNTSRTVTVSSTSTLSIGQAISGTGIPAGAYITNIFNSTTIIISVAATATNTGLTFSFGTAITVGRTFAGAQGDAYANHDHGVNDPGHTHTLPQYNTTQGTSAGGSTLYPGPPNNYTSASNTTGVTVNNSYTGNTETRPKNYAILYIIKT